jgi:hypothetical protein
VFFRVNQATPGQGNFLAITNVLINELLTHADPPFEDAVELFNPTTQPVDISNWWLSNNRDDPKRYRVPQGTVIPAGGFKVFYEYQFDANDLGFTFNSYEPGEVVLCGGDAAGNLTGDRLQQSFGPAANGVSFGRSTTSRGADFVAGRQRTFGVDAPADLGEFRNGNGATNAYPLVGPVVINEVMYRPPDYLVGGLPVDNSDDEFIELLNPGSAPVPLYDPVYPTNRWRLRNAVSFDFPSSLVMAAQSTLLVLNFNPTNTAMLDAFRARFNVPSDVLVVGPYSGKLDNRGETVELLKPDAPQPPGRPHPGLVPYVLVDAVAYEDRAPWPVSPDGLGDSLQRRSAVVYGNDPVHWLGAAPTPGRLNAVESPVMESAARTFAGEFSFQFTALAGVAYAVEWLADLNGASPVSLTNIPAALESYTVRVRDPGIATNGPARYYRVRVVPVSTSGF